MPSPFFMGEILGKRSDFVRIERDAYYTPIKAVLPLIPHLPKSQFSFIEPCAGDGRLISHIEELSNGKCIYAADIEPRNSITQNDALGCEISDIPKADFLITNPPWNRKFLHPFIEKWVSHYHMWLLFDADWPHTLQSSAFMKDHCTKIVSIGRVKWIENSKMTGKDNCAWYLFENSKQNDTIFVGR